MKNVKYILFTILFIFMNVFYVNASCTNEEFQSLVDLAKDIKITYKHKGKFVINNDGETQVDYYSFDVVVKNIYDDFYITYLDDTESLEIKDETAQVVLSNGNWFFSIYSKKCNEKVYDINVFLPRFNIYSLNPLCEGIDGDDFALCGKYYEYDVDYDNFVARVNHYRVTHKINNDDNVDVEEENDSIELIIDKLLNFILTNRLYILIILAVILVILLIISITKRIKKRGVLE